MYVQCEATIRNKTAKVNLHCYFYDGNWNIGREEHKNRSYKPDVYFSPDMTEFWQGKFYAMILEKVRTWAKANPDAFVQAEQRERSTAIENRRIAIEKHEARVKYLKDEVERLEKGENICSYPIKWSE
jgi:hypothetical protein